MKNDYFFLALTIALLVSQFLVSQTLFNNYTMDASGYNKMLKNAPDIDIEFIKEKTYFFNLNASFAVEESCCVLVLAMYPFDKD